MFRKKEKRHVGSPSKAEPKSDLSPLSQPPPLKNHMKINAAGIFVHIVLSLFFFYKIEKIILMIA